MRAGVCVRNDTMACDLAQGLIYVHTTGLEIYQHYETPQDRRNIENQHVLLVPTSTELGMVRFCEVCAATKPTTIELNKTASDSMIFYFVFSAVQEMGITRCKQSGME